MDVYERRPSDVTRDFDSAPDKEARPEPRRGPVRALAANFLEAAFPRLCLHCDTALDLSVGNSPLRNVLCAACRAAMKAAPDFCFDCGVPQTGGPAPCGRPCSGGAAVTYLDGLSWIWSYEGPTSKALTAMKFARLDFLCDALIEAGLPSIEGRLPAFDAVVPVPLFWLRRWTRGYDQGRLLATAVGRRLSIPVMPVLRRRRRTAVQSTLSEAERHRNLAGAFSLRRLRRGPSLTGRRLLLVDDVLTTGATLDAAAAPLKAAGAHRVWSLTVARTPQKHRERPDPGRGNEASSSP